MTINCYLNFNGNCREALAFYEQVFQTSAKTMTFGQLPPNGAFALPEETKSMIMHGQLEICGNRLMFADVFPDRAFVLGNNISISLSGSDKAQLAHWFNSLSAGGQIEMPLDATFWSELYGSLVDRFGIGWQVNYQEDEKKA